MMKINVITNISLNLVISEFGVILEFEPCNISGICETMFELALCSFFL